MIRRVLFLLGLSALLLAVLPASAQAAVLVTPVDPPICKTSLAHLVNRPENGNHGQWANDTFTRTVKICETGVIKVPIVPAAVLLPISVDVGVYHATLADDGTFVTVPGSSSPRQGLVVGPQNGSFSGGFTADFKAAPNFADYVDFANGQTFVGSAGPSTPLWVRSYFTGSNFAGTSINNDWSWTYKTCAEQWIDAFANQDGSLPAAGDIVGAPCPTPTPAVIVTPTPTATPPVVVSSPLALSVIKPPVTGGGWQDPLPGALIQLALVVLGCGFLGGLASWYVRRRKTVR